MADARYNLQEDDETESLSSEETTGRTPDMRMSDSGRRSDERTDRIQETESRSFLEKKDREDSVPRIDETGQIHDYKRSNEDTRENLQQHGRRGYVEMQRRRHETDSRSLPEKKDKEDSFLRINDGQIRDYTHSNNDTQENLQQQRQQRDVEVQRRRHQTESRFWHQERDRYPVWRGSESRQRFDGRAPDWGGSESKWRFDDRTPDWGGSESRLRFDERPPDWGGSESRLRFDERTQRRNEVVHPGETNCRCWPCRNGRSSRYNQPTHPPQELPDRFDEPVCKYFRRGFCQYGSDCVLEHVKDEDGAESMYQDGTRNRRGRESEWGCDERTHRGYDIEPGFRPEKRSKIIPDPQLRDPRKRVEDISHRRHEIEQERMEPIERQRRDAQENLQEQIERQRREAQENLQYQGGRENRSAADSHPADGIVRGIMQARREGQNNLQEQRERDSIERQRREAQENLQKQRERDSIERQRREAQENLQKQRERDSIERQRREAQENLQKQRERDRIERQKREAQENLQKQRERDRIERQKREAQENLQYWRWRANRSAADSQLLERVARGFTERLRREDQELNPQQQRLQEMPEIRRNRVTRPPKRFGR